MKRIGKILIAVVLVAILFSEFSCSHRTCRYMKGYRSDVKRGLAH